MPTIWKISNNDKNWINSAEFKHALSLLSEGNIIAVPTETVYGLAADATNDQACQAIFQAKGRPSFNPLISHFSDLVAAQSHGKFNSDAKLLANKFWPGPLTIVVPTLKNSGISKTCTAGLDTVAIRIPASPILCALASSLNVPLAAPSANSSGKVSPTSAQDVFEELGENVAMIIDGGTSSIGIESTVISCANEHPTLLRAGGIPTSEIESVLKKKLAKLTTNNQSPASPGMLTSHYAPNSPLKLNVSSVDPTETLLAFGRELPTNASLCQRVFNLSETADLKEAASKLYTGLRTLDKICSTAIAVMPIPKEGFGEAINDRLSRAAKSNSPKE